MPRESNRALISRLCDIRSGSILTIPDPTPGPERLYLARRTAAVIRYLTPRAPLNMLISDHYEASM